MLNQIITFKNNRKEKNGEEKDEKEEKSTNYQQY